MKKQHRKPKILFLLLTACSIVVILSLVYRAQGWPVNHDGTVSLQTIEVYATHLKEGDIFPIWSTSDGFGMGSPMPLYYQKAFFYVSGFVDILTGAVKTAAVVSIAAFLILGAYGMRAAIKQITSRKILWLLAPQAFLFSNYVFTDWLVRGDFAEFSAMMLVPWSIYWCIRLIKEKHFSLSIIPIAILLFDAHNAIAMISLPMFVIAIAIYLFVGRQYNLKSNIKRAAISALAIIVILSPILITQYLFNADYNPSGKITQNGYTPTSQFKPPLNYFYDAHYTWLANWMTYTVQIDVSISLALILLVLLGIYKLLRPRMTNLKFNKEESSIVIFLVICLAIYLSLQFKFTTFVYNMIKPLDLIQFPWRMLAFITPIGIILSVYLFEKLYSISSRFKFVITILVLIWTIPFFILSPVSHHFIHTFIPSSEYQTPKSGLLYSSAIMLQGGEYLPRLYNNSGQKVSNAQTYSESVYTYLFINHKEAESLTKGSICQFTQPSSLKFESLKIKFNINCSSPSTVALPISYSRYMRIYNISSDGDLSVVHFFREDTDPRVLIRVDKNTNIQVNVPTLGYILSHI